MYLNTATFEDGDTTVCGSKIDSNDSAIILICFCTCKERWQKTEGGEEGTRP